MTQIVSPSEMVPTTIGGCPTLAVETTDVWIPVVYQGSNYKMHGSVLLAGTGSGTVTSVAVDVPAGLSVTGSPVTDAGTIEISFAAGYSIPTNVKQATWDTAYTDRNKWDGGSTGLIASTGRISLGASTIGSNVFTLSNPSAITFPRFNADNTVSALNASDFRTAIGATGGSGTVTSVGLSLPSELTVTNSPVTGSGTLTGTWVSQTAKYFLAAPNASAGTPSFRAIVASDIPTLNQNTTGSSASCTGNAATASTANALNTANDYQVVNLKATGRIALADGTAALPSLYFNSDGVYDTGLYWGGDGYINFANNGVYSGQITNTHNLVMVGTVTSSNLSGTNTGDQTGGTPALTFSTTNTAGGSTNFLRRDDTIAVFDTTSPSTQAFGDSAAVGTAAVAARRDHKHAMPAQPTTVDGTNPIGFKNIPHSGTDKTTSYTLATTDVGKYISIGSGGSITIPNSTFADGDAVTVYNNTSTSATITCTITTAYIAGTDVDKATVSLATRGLATIFFNSGTACVIMGNVS